MKRRREAVTIAFHLDLQDEARPKLKQACSEACCKLHAIQSRGLTPKPKVMQLSKKKDILEGSWPYAALKKLSWPHAALLFLSTKAKCCSSSSSFSLSPFYKREKGDPTHVLRHRHETTCPVLIGWKHLKHPYQCLLLIDCNGRRVNS